MQCNCHSSFGIYQQKSDARLPALDTRVFCALQNRVFLCLAGHRTGAIPCGHSLLPENSMTIATCAALPQRPLLPKFTSGRFKYLAAAMVLLI